MPVQHGYTIKQWTVAKLLLIYARDAADGQSGKRGLRPDTPGATAAYIRESECQAHAIPLVPGEVGAHRPGGFVEVDPELLPGVYQFGVPDELLAPNAETVLLALEFPGAVIEPIEIDLVAYDPQDADRLGMAALVPERRIAALRGAFPRLSTRELDEVVARKEPESVVVRTDFSG